MRLYDVRGHIGSFVGATVMRRAIAHELASNGGIFNFAGMKTVLKNSCDKDDCVIVLLGTDNETSRAKIKTLLGDTPYEIIVIRDPIALWPLRDLQDER